MIPAIYSLRYINILIQIITQECFASDLCFHSPRKWHTSNMSNAKRNPNSHTCRKHQSAVVLPAREYCLQTDK